MRRLLSGDLRRIMSKKSFVIFFILMCMASMVFLITGQNDGKINGFTFVTGAASSHDITVFVIGLVIFMGVYADEFKSMAMSSVIGRGISRKKFIVAKLLDSLILILFYTVVSIIMYFIYSLIRGIGTLPVENKYMYISIFLNAYTILIYIAVSSLVLYACGNIAIGIFTYIGLNIIIPLAISWTAMMPFMMKYHPDRYYISGLVWDSFADFMLGRNLYGALKLLICTVVYLGGMAGLSMFLFKNKELDF